AFMASSYYCLVEAGKRNDQLAEFGIRILSDAGEVLIDVDIDAKRKLLKYMPFSLSRNTDRATNRCLSNCDRRIGFDEPVAVIVKPICAR
ncbi:MAG: hypothetical protein AAGC71_18315, partial [Pseudomonadota bacterium]